VPKSLDRGVVRGRFRLVVIGLDSVSPELLARFSGVTPNLQRLLRTSYRGTLRSCDPPITVPAWAVMFSGVDPGSLGLYGFRHRTPGSYDRMYSPTSATPRRPMVWELLSRLGKRVAVLGMPPGYPPPTLNGVAISDFLTPASARDWVRPGHYAEELSRTAGGPFFDVPFRVENRQEVARSLLEMTRRRWRVARRLWSEEEWDLFAVHDIGPDRLHHTFWKYFDERHPRYEYRPELADVARDFYSLLDQEIGQFLERVGDDVAVLVASDHGSQAMQGCFCVNEWLVREGYLALREPPARPGLPLEEASVDWERTRVWAAGGYYARFFFNLRGREPHGRLEKSSLPDLIRNLRGELERVRRPDGSPLGVRLFLPREVYREVTGDPPDLMAYFDETRWRSAGTLGHGRLFLEENDTGPDDAVHSFDGVISWHGPGQKKEKDLGQQRILDVAPTVLRAYGVSIPPYFQGVPISAIEPD
jgi:predicted AlkP superfamily phosphohydrolase/phosphomutase